jgi:lysophospholipase L1-like esterase
MSTSVFEKHPKRTMAVVLAILALILLILSEILLRFLIPYNIGYYTAVRSEGAYEYPYGTIHINSDGYPDEEFDRASKKKKIGYFGDSVTFGVGAGAGYRFSDLLQNDYPAYEHWTFSMIANGIQDMSILDKAEEYDLDTVVYLLNLNDLLPVAGSDSAHSISSKENHLQSLIGFASTHLDGLRDKSYVFNTLRTAFKNMMMRMGYGHIGFKSIELYPNENEQVIRDVASLINQTAQSMNERGINFCIVLLPYEMQISDHAATTYASLGIDWEEGFERGSTQDILRRHLKTKNLYDGRWAFDDVKATNLVGTYFVYNKGDKIDFNHPNREGHSKLANGFKTAKTCPFVR